MEPQTQLQTQTLLPSPTSSSSSSSNTTKHTTTTTTHNGGGIPTTPKQHQQQTMVTRSETNPYPTTFVQADTSSFKQVVQMLTGSSDPSNNKSSSSSSPSNTNTTKQGNPIPPIKTPNKSKPSKLYERRSTSLKSLRLNTTNPSIHHHRNNNNNNNNSYNYHHHYHTSEILSPSLLDFPSLVLSPVTPLIHDPFTRSPISSNSSPSPNNNNNIVVDKLAEDKAIADKAFFLHPSPVSTTPRDSEPRLLTLFPLSSPRSESSS